tara:strand:- start:167 stop:466 length:300 start_codon:yes stop_codon:yes gene_type:complete
MFDKINGNKFSLGVTIAIATQIVGGLLYFNSLVTTLNHTAEQVEELVTDVQALQGKVQNQSFTIDRLSYQNQFQNEALKETVSDLEQEISVIESLIMSR